MDKRTFIILYNMLRTTDRLALTQCIDVQEMVAIFLHILAHDVKNRVVCRQFARSGEIVSRNFRFVLTIVLQLHELLLKKLEPITSDCTNSRWKLFENCLGVLDDTYIKVNVGAADCPRYRTRKGEIDTNGGKGQPVDSRVLRDAISRPYGLKVPKAREIGKTTISGTMYDEDSTSNELGDENIQFIETSDEWTNFNDELATQMFDEWEQAS
ncbi:uncharacterized protein LOC120081095 [Benincasa hispida]|uniref:uncharacterized protein LOC120081095 n=1 Tax=Benincasa hispida TaxID=102211 RepID=UPI0019003463|nr:uncharacterized protein LOC120081095 [Benincasa hispida]